MIASLTEEVLRESQTTLCLQIPECRLTHEAKLEKIKLFKAQYLKIL
jgi:hypothetical protein